MAVNLRSLVSRSRSLILPSPLCRTKHTGNSRLRLNGLELIGFREPEILPSFEQRLNENNPRDSEVDRLINIGYSTSKPRREQRQLEKEQAVFLKKVRNDPVLEKAARHHELTIPLDEVRKSWENCEGPEQICGAAMHYGIFRDLYGAAYFISQFPLNVSFPSTTDYETPVYRGNLIGPSDALTAPSVSFPSADDSLWTLLLTNLDGNLKETDAEYVHWFIGNIPGGDVSKGETVVDYLQPIPVRGTGLHRYVFVLYKQERKMNFSDLRELSQGRDLWSRTFRTPEFYKYHQDNLTPTSMAFFTTEWDESVTKCFHKTLDRTEPAFTYEHQPLYHTPQQKFPHQQPFNLYLDRYRDKREIAEEMVKKRLQNISPFEADPPASKWPMLGPSTYSDTYLKNIPSWKRIEIRKERLGHARYKLLYDPMATWPN